MGGVLGGCWVGGWAGGWVDWLVGWLTGWLAGWSILKYPRGGSAETTVRAATPKCKLQIKLAISPRFSILTPGRPVPLALSELICPGSLSFVVCAALKGLGCLTACLLRVPATCLCISGTDLLRQVYVLPH